MVWDILIKISQSFAYIVAYFVYWCYTFALFTLAEYFDFSFTILYDLMDISYTNRHASLILIKQMFTLYKV